MISGSEVMLLLFPFLAVFRYKPAGTSFIIRICHFIFTLGLVHCNSVSQFEKNNNVSHTTIGFTHSPAISHFHQLGVDAGTDKVVDHHYEYVYGKYLSHHRMNNLNGKIKILEIGLGCNMPYGAGKSVKLWKSWFKHLTLDLHEMEYDADCVTKWKTDLEKLDITVHVGDQSKVEDILKIFDKVAIKPGLDPVTLGENQFDVIIDDGGHYFNQIQTSFDNLFEKALKPGGIYVIEDIAPARPWYPGREYNDGQVINWLQGMMATVLGNAGRDPKARGKDWEKTETDPMNMHALQGWRHSRTHTQPPGRTHIAHTAHTVHTHTHLHIQFFSPFLNGVALWMALVFTVFFTRYVLFPAHH